MTMPHNSSHFFLKKYKDFEDNLDFSQTSLCELSKEFYVGSTKNSHKSNMSDLNISILRFYLYDEFSIKSELLLNDKEQLLYEEQACFIEGFSKDILHYSLVVCFAEMLNSHTFENTQGLMYLCKQHKVEKNSTINSPYYQKYLKEKQNFLKYESWANINIDITEREFEKFVEKHKSEVSKKIKNDNPNIEDRCIQLFVEKSFYFKGLMPLLSSANGMNMFIEDNFLLHFEDIKIEDFLSCMKTVIKEESSFYKSYGGKLWIDILEHVLLFARGKINTKLFIDQAISLEHNSGNFFDKEIIFKNPNEDRQKLRFNFPSESYEKVHLSLKNTILSLKNSGNILGFIGVQFEEMLENCNFSLISEYIGSLKLEHGFAARFKANLQSMLDIKKFILKTDNELGNNLVAHINHNRVIGQKIFSLYNFFNSIPHVYGQNVDFNKYIEGKVSTQFEKNNILKEIEITEQIFNNFSIIKEKQKNFLMFRIGKHSGVKNIKQMGKLSGKAKSLIEMNQMGLNVPEAMIIHSLSTRQYYVRKGFFLECTERRKEELLQFMSDNLVSVRSGSIKSMPGIMNTILNVGIDDSNYDILCKKYDKRLIDENAGIFMRQFSDAVFGIKFGFKTTMEENLKTFKGLLKKHNWRFNENLVFPLNKWQQIYASIEAVIGSWNNPRAIAWRNLNQIQHDIGTDCIIQHMVYGNKSENSLSAVVFSSNCESADSKIQGEYIRKSQGEDIVGGLQTPKKIDDLLLTDKQLYNTIYGVSKFFEKKYKRVQDIEITVEDGKVYFLQRRSAEQSLGSKIETYRKYQKPNIFTEGDFSCVDQIEQTYGAISANNGVINDYAGLPVNGGAITGIIIRNEEDYEDIKNKNPNQKLIFLTRQALPEHSMILSKCDAIITEHGGVTSHAAILARMMKKPCIVGIGDNTIASMEVVTIDSSNGKIWVSNHPNLKKGALEIQKVMPQKILIEINKQKDRLTYLVDKIFWLNKKKEQHVQNEQDIDLLLLKKMIKEKSFYVVANNHQIAIIGAGDESVKMNRK